MNVTRGAFWEGKASGFKTLEGGGSSGNNSRKAAIRRIKQDIISAQTGKEWVDLVNEEKMVAQGHIITQP